MLLRWRTATLALIGTAGCDAVFGIDKVDDYVPPADAAIDAPPDGPPPPRCDPSQPFSQVFPIEELNSTEASGKADLWPRLSNDELLMIYGSTRDGDISFYIAERASIDMPFATPPRKQPALKVEGTLDVDPATTPDALGVVFASKRPGGVGELDIWYATRSSKLADFGAPAVITGNNVNTVDNEYHPFIAAHDGALWFTTSRADTNANLWRAPAAAGATLGGPFEAPELVTGLSTPAPEGNATLRGDGLAIYFATVRPGGAGGSDIWRATRASTQDAFGTPQVLDINSSVEDIPGWVSPDDCRLYFHSNRGASQAHLYVATRP